MSLDAYRTKLPGHYRLKGNASSSLDNISQPRSSHDQSEEDPIVSTDMLCHIEACLGSGAPWAVVVSHTLSTACHEPVFDE